MRTFDGDRYVLSEASASIKSDVTYDDAINIELLRDETERLGPIRGKSEDSPYEVYVGVYPCECGDDDCEELLVVVWRKSGLFNMRWVISPEELLEFENMGQFFRVVALAGLSSSYGERLLIEGDVSDVFGDDYFVDPVPPCLCNHCVENLGMDELWRKGVLSQLAFFLKQRSEYLEAAEDDGGEEGRDFAEAGFDLGYLMGRVYSEYQTRCNLEPHALSGRDLERLKAKRAKSAGEKSANMRHERMRSLLSHMERLASESPAILRVGPVQLAKLACEDATVDQPNLWAQGSGQVEEYVGKIRRGEVGADMRNRYFALFPDKARHVPKTA